MPEYRSIDGDGPDPGLNSVAGYRLLRRIGSGGMSTVFLSHDVAVGGPVAIKLLADHLAHSREFVSRFYREARLSRLLSNPYLVQGFSAGYDPAIAKHYLILEYVDGPTAQSALNRMGRFPVGMAVKIGLDIAQALSFMHARQFIHRDVKPDNILLDPDGIAKLADLGLAKRLNDDAHLTSVSQGVGTSYYMSYEQSLNGNLVDGRSDIFALGATLYHMLAGEVPFPGATHEEIIQGKRDDLFYSLRERNPDVPPELTGVIDRTLVCDPRSRYQSVDEFAEALKATGLATAIPHLPQSDDLPEGSRSVSSSDVPTRADFKTVDSDGITSTDRLQDPSAASICKAKPTDLPPQKGSTGQTDRGSRFVLGALVTASAIVLGGLLAARSHSHSLGIPAPVTSTQESRETGVNAGLPISVPQ